MHHNITPFQKKITKSFGNLYTTVTFACYTEENKQAYLTDLYISCKEYKTGCWAGREARIFFVIGNLSFPIT